MKEVKIIEYEWAGKLGPFKIKTHCEECDITKSMMDSMLEKEFKGKNVTFEKKPWLDNFFRVLSKGAYHPPILMVNGKKFHQFSERDPLFNKEKVTDHVFKILEQK